MKFSFVAALSVVLALSPAFGQSLPEKTPTAASVPQVVSPSNQDRQWQPTPEQRERVVRDVVVYFAAKDAHRFADAYAMFAPGQKSSVSFERWEAEMQRLYGEAGAAEGRTLKLVTWYHDAANSPPGTFAAVDFSSRFAELSLHCGFVAMQQQLDGSFGVAREEENFIHKREMAGLTPEALQRIRAQYRC